MGRCCVDPGLQEGTQRLYVDKVDLAQVLYVLLEAKDAADRQFTDSKAR